MLQGKVLISPYICGTKNRLFRYWRTDSMRWSETFIPTTKEDPSDADSTSHKLCIRAGLIRPLSAGIFSFLPLGWRVLRKVEEIIRDEMDSMGGQEFFLPALSPSSIWEESGRWDEYGDDMFRLKDRKERALCLVPTHEEIVADLVRNNVRSYRDLPQVWYQVQTKFRDEPRPRSGLLRSREFIMKDSYSLDRDEAGLDASYKDHFRTYKRIFDRCGLETFTVGASSGMMGGSESEEFMLESDAGEDQVVRCPGCGYAANIDVAVSESLPLSAKDEELRTVHTPGRRTVEEVSSFLKLGSEKLMKSLLYTIGEEPVFVLVRGDHEVNESKLTVRLKSQLRQATGEEVRQLTGASVGFVGPIGVKGVRVLADLALEDQAGLVTGANRDDYHYVGVNPGRDFAVTEYCDLRFVKEGESCTRCGSELKMSRAIELGHIFKLGTRYSERMGATYLDSEGMERPVVMGSYGIGLERILVAAIEQNADEDGIVWPAPLAPFDAVVVPLNMSDSRIVSTSELLYAELGRNLDILLDDRDERAGSKFKDSDLIGIPLRITVGERGLKRGVVELRQRKTGEVREYALDTGIEDLRRGITEFFSLSPKRDERGCDSPVRKETST
jgi:prolyl-tRNA synthetase